MERRGERMRRWAEGREGGVEQSERIDVLWKLLLFAERASVRLSDDE
jgi:hypothetical protein